MNFLTRFSIKNAAAIIILCILVIGGGLYSSYELKKETMPDVSIPIVGVITVYPGASPSDVQEKITKPLEDLVSSVTGLTTVSSTSGENVSSVIAMFDYSADMDEAQRKIESAIKSIKLPDGAIAPKIMRVDFGAFPVMNISISNDKLTPEELEQKVRENVIPVLSGAEGVGQVQIASDLQKSVNIKLIPAKLKENNITSQTVTQMLQANNISIPAGSLSMNETVEPVRISGKFNSVEDIKNLKLTIAPNMQELTKSSFSQVGEGVASLGKAVGQLGQGVAGVSQVSNAQIKIVTAITETQAQIFDAKLAINDANQTLKNPSATEQQKQIATMTLQEVTPKLQMAQAAISQMQAQLKAIQAKLPKSGSTVPSVKAQEATTNEETSSQQIKHITLGEIAEVTVGIGKTNAFCRTNGSPSVVLQILKTQESNTVDVSDSVSKKLVEINKTMPEGTKNTVIVDQATSVKESIEGMVTEGLLGAFFAFLIILLFLRNIRTTIIASISMPLSVLITLVFLKQMNVTLNIITLGALSVAIGRIVDDSIVVIENVYRHLTEDDDRTSSVILLGAKEVSSAITSSTLTTVAVFLPMAFVGGIAGIMFKPFAITVSISLLSSLLVAVTVIPLMSKFLLLKAKSIKKENSNHGKMMNFYENILLWSLDHKIVVMLIAATLLGASIALVPRIGTSFMPEQKEKYVSIAINYPAGTDVKVVNDKALEIEKLLSSEKDVEIYQTTIGTPGSANPMGMLTAKGSGSFMLKLKPEADVDSVVARLRTGTQSKGKEKIDVTQTNTSSMGSSGMNNMEVDITGSDSEDIIDSAALLMKELENVKGLERITNNLSQQKPEISIKVDQKKAGEYTLSAAQVGMHMRELLNDNNVTTMMVDNKTLDVKMGLKLDVVKSIEDIKSIEVLSPLGTAVKLSDIAEVSEVPGPVSIFTSDGQSCAKITAFITEKNTGAVSTRVQEKIDALQFPAGIKIKMAGVTEMMSDTYTDLGIAMVIAVFAVFFVMVIALGEAIAPVAILFSLPLAAIGGLLALFVTNLPIDMPSMIGDLMLIGIVVTNAIVLIDRVQQRRRDGMAVRDALIEAGRIRMRPILMTAIATIAALFPMALGISKGSVMSRSLAVVVIGGLTTSTFLTLVVVPVAYEMLQNLKTRILGKNQITVPVIKDPMIKDNNDKR